MTDLTKLADALENIAHMEYPSGHHDGNNLREAARVLRSAAGVDVAGLSKRVRQARILACGAWSDVTEGGTVNSKKCNEAQKMEDELCAAINALESALRLVLAQRVPQDYVLQLLVAAGHVTQEKVDQSIAIAAAAPQAKEQGK